MKIWLLPKEDVLNGLPNTQKPRPVLKPRPTKPVSGLPPEGDTTPTPELPTPASPQKPLNTSAAEQLPDSPRPRRVNPLPAEPPTEVEYAQRLPEVAPQRRARKDFGKQPIEEQLPSVSTYQPLAQEQRTGFKARVKGALNALQNAGAYGADGAGVLGALIGGTVNPNRANQVKWHRTVELPEVSRRAAAEDSMIKRQKIRNETEEAETKKETADHLFYGTDATRENDVHKLKTSALRTAEDRAAASQEKGLDRNSAQTIAKIQAQTSSNNNIRTNDTSSQNNIRTNETSRENNIRTNNTNTQNNIRTTTTTRQNNRDNNAAKLNTGQKAEQEKQQWLAALENAIKSSNGDATSPAIQNAIKHLQKYPDIETGTGEGGWPYAKRTSSPSASGKSFPAAQLEKYAADHKTTPEEARRFLEANGYTIR